MIGRDQGGEAQPSGNIRRREQGAEAHSAILSPSSPYRSLVETEHARSLTNGSANGRSSAVKRRAQQAGGSHHKAAVCLSPTDSNYRVRTCHSHVHLALNFCADL
jgi:hypothetical protein